MIDNALKVLLNTNAANDDPVPQDLITAIYELEKHAQFLDADERGETQRAIKILIEKAVEGL